MRIQSMYRFIALASLAGLTLTGCGSDDAATQLPSAGGAATGGNESTTTVSPETAVQNYISCLRDQGITVADPKMGTDGNVDMRSIFDSIGDQRNSDTFRAADEQCRQHLQGAGFGPSSDERKARQEAMLAFTSCLRNQGLDVADLTFDGPGGRPPGAGGPGASGASGASGTTGTSGATGATGASGGGAPGGPPEGPRGSRTPEERNAFLAERLGLDINDTAVSAAFAACSTELETATARPGQTTTTTA